MVSYFDAVFDICICFVPYVLAERWGVILRLWSHISDVFHCRSVFGGDGMYFLSMVMLLLVESRVV